MRQRDEQQAGAGCARLMLRALAGSAANRGFTLIELVVVIMVISILAAIVLPSYIKVKEKAKEAECKAGLHAIQLSLERFNVDHGDQYPTYLIGGNNTSLVIRYGDDDQVSYNRDEIPFEQCSDPLLRTGYCESYPKNPFVSNAQGVQQLQGQVGDPLRSGLPDGHFYGTRFGAQGNLMGQALCESRYLEWQYCDPVTLEQRNELTWCNVQYEFFDVWAGSRRQRLHLPGAFAYKVIGEIVAQPDAPGNQELVEVDGKKAIVPLNNRDSATYPVSLTNYILSAWGGFRTKGMDILGEEPLVIFTFPGSLHKGGIHSDFIFNPNTGRYETAKPTFDHYELLGVPPWTRGVNRSHIGPLWGSPYGPSPRTEEQLSIGNANGYRDALIIVLSGGEGIS